MSISSKPIGATGYSQQFNLGIQRELARNIVLEVGYIGNLSRKLRYCGDEHQPDSRRNLIDAIRPAGVFRQGFRPYPQFNNVAIQNPTLGVTDYHAGVLKLQKRFSGGFNFTPPIRGRRTSPISTIRATYWATRSSFPTITTAVRTRGRRRWISTTALPGARYTSFRSARARNGCRSGPLARVAGRAGRSERSRSCRRRAVHSHDADQHHQRVFVGRRSGPM